MNKSIIVAIILLPIVLSINISYFKEDDNILNVLDQYLPYNSSEPVNGIIILCNRYNRTFIDQILDNIPEDYVKKTIIVFNGYCNIINKRLPVKYKTLFDTNNSLRNVLQFIDRRFRLHSALTNTLDKNICDQIRQHHKVVTDYIREREYRAHKSSLHKKKQIYTECINNLKQLHENFLINKDYIKKKINAFINNKIYTYDDYLDQKCSNMLIKSYRQTYDRSYVYRNNQPAFTNSEYPDSYGSYYTDTGNIIYTGEFKDGLPFFCN
jgi:hypothetical protein